jgi:hypothetical protein
MQRRRPACFVVFGNGQCPDAQSAKLASLKRSGRPDTVHQSPRHSPSLAGGWVITIPCVTQRKSVPPNDEGASPTPGTAIATRKTANDFEPIDPRRNTSNSQPDRHHAQAGGREFKTAHARKTARRFLAAEAWTYNAASRPKGRVGDMISGSCQPLALRGFEAPGPKAFDPDIQLTGS